MNHFRLLLLGTLLSAVPTALSAAIFTVNTPTSALTTGSLAWAVDRANTNPGLDTIRFSIGNGPVTVLVPGILSISDEVVLDGSTQPGYGGTPIVTLRNAAGPAGAFFGTFNAAGTIIRGLCFAGPVYQSYILIQTNNITIESCWFGVERTLAEAGSPGAPAILLRDESPGYSNVNIRNCLFGYCRNAVKMDDALNVRITDCAIGTDFDGNAILPLTGAGILVLNSTDTYIGSGPGGPGNVIANCVGEGIGLIASTDTVMINNRIYDNLAPPIDYELDGVHKFAENLDADNLTGGEQNVPALQTIHRSNGTIVVTGQLKSRPSTAYMVEVFASEGRANFFRGEAKYKVGILTGTTNASGILDFSSTFIDSLPGSQTLFYCASATRLDQSYGSSELSDSRLATYEALYTESALDTAAGWIPSGVDSGPEYLIDPTSPDDIDLSKSGGALNITVRPSAGRNRIAGWTNPSLMLLPESLASAQTFVRGKFYVYASNPMGAPLNTVPSFRVRIENEGTVLSSTVFQYGLTGRSAPPHEPYYNTLNDPATEAVVGPSLRPSNNPLKPSLYRVDYVPPLTPATGGTRIGATFEAMGTEDPADGVLSLAEVQLGTFQVQGYTDIKMQYSNDANFSALIGANPGTPYTVRSGKFNAEADFQAGRRQVLDLPGEVPDSVMASIVETPDDKGTLLDTLNVPADKLGVGLFNVVPDVSTTAPRVAPNISYVAIFVLSSDMPASPAAPGEKEQGSLNLQMQTGGGAVTTRLELVGPASLTGAPGSPGRMLLEQALPGSHSVNWYAPNYPFPPGEAGGAYVVMMPSPLSYDTRPLTPGDLGPWGDQPGPGVLAPSLRDISVGVNAISHPSMLRVSPSLVIPWAAPNRARVRLLGVIVAEAPDIDDGGYTY